MKRASIIVAALAIAIGMVWTITAVARNTAKTSGCGCVECACPDCNGEFCTCDTCECDGCGCLATTGAPKRINKCAAEHSCCAAKTAVASAAKFCASANCECPDCDDETCACEPCECADCGCSK